MTAWHNAMTLAERTRRFGGAIAGAPSCGFVTERGRRRLARWSAQPPFDSGGLFQQRLDQAGLSRDVLLRLLSAPAGEEPTSPSETPAWAQEVISALSDERDDGQVNIGFDHEVGPPELLFLELVRPLILRALDRFRDGLRDLTRGQPHSPFSPEAAERVCLGLLPEALLSVLARTLVLELNVARVQGRLFGQTGEERFASFIDRLRQPQVRAEFFGEYPVLARLVAETLQDWEVRSLEVLKRCHADWAAIRGDFSPGHDPGSLVHVAGDAGDRHRGGRTVWILEFSSGFKLVYKPKPLAVDRHFQEVLLWLNECGLSVPFRPLRILDRGDYGWEEFVSPEACSCREEVGRFYQRTGGYLALLYALGAADFHYENLLAMGEHPVLIDLEALFHPPGLEPPPVEAGDIADSSLGESVLGSGLLPVPISGGRESGLFDLSGLGAEPGREMPVRAPGWKNCGTDEMQFARESQVIGSAGHRPRLNGVTANPLDYLEEMETGFGQVYRVIETRRDELCAGGGLLERFTADEVRVVLRDSNRYGALLLEASHPDVLRDGLDRDRLFDRLWEDVPDRPRLAQLIPTEIEDLWRGDIPLFTTRPGSRDLWAGFDRHFPAVLNESGLERARQRIEAFGSADLQRQLWFLRGSLTTLASGRPVARSRSRRLTQTATAVDREQFLAASCAVGDRLVEMALHGAEDVTWIGLNLVRQKQWVLTPLGLDFYDGVPGISLFLAYLGFLSGRQRYGTLARAALETMRRRLDPAARKKNFGKIGAFVGWGGVIYTLAHLGVLWDEPALLAEAEQFVEALSENIPQDLDLDIISGAAGAIAALLCLQSCRPTARVIEVAKLCGELLLGRARPMPHGLGWLPSFASYAPLAGFSHGAAGISWALLELAAHTGEERFRTAALGGMAYERSLFSPDAGNWPDLRIPEPGPNANLKETPPFAVALCHGAPGIGLSRLLCRRLLNDALVDAEIDRALRKTVASGFGDSHCLCHGDLGNLEVVLEASRAWPESAWRQQADSLAAGILNSIRTENWVCGNPLSVESPGLMTGLAGIGYGLLRCADPARVPSVLSLDPPPVL